MPLRQSGVGLTIAFGLLLVCGLAGGSERPVDFASVAGTGVLVSDIGSTTGGEPNGGASCDCANSCNSECGCDCEHCWHWTAGAEGTFLSPNTHPNILGPFSIPDFGWEAAPRIWLGVEGESGWGRVRYWQLDAEANRFGITPALAPNLIADLSQQLEMFYVDAEVTKQIDYGCWSLLGIFGGRFASLGQVDLLNFFETQAPATSAFESLDREINAGGITAGLELSRPIGWGGLDVFGDLRGSALWGTSTSSIRARVNDAGNPTGGTLGPFSQDTDLTIWEAQVGLQCSKCLKCCEGTVFGRCAFEYQSWIVTPGRSGVDLYGVAVAVGFQH